MSEQKETFVSPTFYANYFKVRCHPWWYKIDTSMIPNIAGHENIDTQNCFKSLCSMYMSLREWFQMSILFSFFLVKCSWDPLTGFVQLMMWSDHTNQCRIFTDTCTSNEASVLLWSHTSFSNVIIDNFWLLKAWWATVVFI